MHVMVWLVLAAHLKYLTVQVQHMGGARTLVQVIYILSNNVHVEVLLQFCKNVMSRVGLCIGHILSTIIIETKYQFLVLFPCTRGGDILYIISFPKPI